MTILYRLKKITLRLALLLCVIQWAGIVVYAQEPVEQDTQRWIDRNTEDPEEEPREQPGLLNDTVGVNRRYWENVLEHEGAPVDSATIDSLRGDRRVPGPFLTPEEADSIAVRDSIAVMNQVNLEGVDGSVILDIDQLAVDSLAPVSAGKVWIPNSNKATWLALVIPGGGQIYNRKYWKLPIIYGGFAGCAYALTWNTQMYKDYSQAYVDLMDNNPNTNSFLDLLPPNYTYSEAQLAELLRKRKDRFRRYRDMSIFAFIGVYLISVIDAYVDAELSDFDITPDLSMRVGLTLMNEPTSNARAFGIQCSVTF
ncbi:MAG: DUF5683 domain-containing protein [Bacteroides sp.]|nr:DUF5683 domain-containing protein [Bacteroides sp.]